MVRRLTVRPPAIGERALAVVTIFLLAAGVPVVWFQADNADVPTGDKWVIIVNSVLFALAFTYLVGQWATVARAIRREPFLLAFVTFMVASTLWSTTPGDTLRRSSAIFLTTLFGYYLVVRFSLREIIRLTAIALIGVTITQFLWIVALPKYGISQITDAFTSVGDWSGVYPHKNSLGRGAVVAAIVFIFAARALPRRRVLYWTFFALNVVLVIGSNSKTALVALILVPLLMLLFTGLRGHATLYGGVAFGLVSSGLLGAAFVTTNLGPITQSLGRDATLTGRTQLWGDVIHEIGRHPWVGFGWLGYWTGTMDGPSRYVLERNTWNPPNAHNAVLEIMLNLGTIGAVLFLIPYVRGLFRSIGQVRRVPNILGLFPITYFSFVLLQSITEIGVVGRDLTWTLFVVAAVFATGDRSYGALAGAGPVPVSTDLHPSRNEATVPARAIGPSDVDAAPRAGDRAGDADHAEPAGAAAPARVRTSFTVRRGPT